MRVKTKLIKNNKARIRTFPLRLLFEPFKHFLPGGVSFSYATPPQIPPEIEASVIRYVKSRSQRRVSRQALVHLHLLVENHFKHELISRVPARRVLRIYGDTIITDPWSKSEVVEVLTDADLILWSCNRLAILQDVGVESRR